MKKEGSEEMKKEGGERMKTEPRQTINRIIFDAINMENDAPKLIILCRDDSSLAGEVRSHPSPKMGIF